MLSSSPRVMIYTQDSFGLGHLRRATNLANELVRVREDLSVLLIVDSPVAPFFELSPHVDFIKLPTVVKVDAGVFRSGRLLTSYDWVSKMRSNLIREIVLRFMPHVLLVDHMPGGANRELLPALRMVRRRRLPMQLFLGLRDIIDDPKVTCSVWKKERVYYALKRYYDRVLIYGTPDVFDTAAEYRLPKAIKDRVDYCGYVCNMDEVKPPERVRAKLGVDEGPIVAVMAGGGADGYLLMQTYLEAAKVLGTRRSFASAVITGPFMPENERKLLRDRAKDMGIHLRSTVGDALSQINAADVVVTMAGYNTLSEILRFGKPAVVIPRPGPSAEQTMRARILERRGLLRMIEQERLDPYVLASAVDQALDATPTPASRSLDLGGVGTASDVILRALPHKAPPALEPRPAQAPTRTSAETTLVAGTTRT